MRFRICSDNLFDVQHTPEGRNDADDSENHDLSPLPGIKALRIIVIPIGVEELSIMIDMYTGQCAVMVDGSH